MATNKGITVRFQSDEWLPKSGDYSDYKLHYSFVNSDLLGKPEEESQTKNGYIIIRISGTLSAIWGFADEDLRKILFEYGKRHISKLISEGAPIDCVGLQLNSYNFPEKCPFDPNQIDLNFDKPINF